MLIEFLGYILGACVVGMILLATIAYWRLTLFFLGIILVNIFTLWLAVILFGSSIAVLTYNRFKEKTLTTQIFFQEIVVGSGFMTIMVVLFSLALNVILNQFGGGGGCSRGNPAGC